MKGLLASLTDSGISALASLLVGFMALRLLSTTEFALYGLLLAAGVLAMTIPQQMGYFPRRIAVNVMANRVRPSYGSDFTSTLPFGGLAVAVVLLGGMPLYGDASLQSAVSLSVTASLWVLSSPLQDHVRTSLHITGHHSRAATVSVVQLFAVVVPLTVAELSWTPGPPAGIALVPFGSLALANIVSLTVGIWLHRKVPLATEASRTPFRLRIRSAAPGFIAQLTGYLSSALVAVVLGAGALATLEASRIVAQPVVVLSTGLAAFFMPPIVRMMQTGNPDGGFRRLRVMLAIQASVGAAYAACALLLSGVFANAAGRTVDGPLSAARASAFAIQTAVNPLIQIQIADKRFRDAVFYSIASGAVTILSLVVLLPILGEFAVPASAAAGGLTLGGLFLRGNRSH